MKIEVINESGISISVAEGSGRVTLVHPGRYHRGDRVVFTCDEPGWYDLCLEDALPAVLVYVKEQVVFRIPFGTMSRVCYPPRSFKGKQHLLTAALADMNKVALRRNLALNPLDQHGETGMWPHSAANVETRGEALFAARNAIDGIYANSHHYPYPYQSWGINKNPNAELTIDFGVAVTLDEIVLTLRADYPHDSYWIRATIEFDDGSREVLELKKSTEPQHFPINKRTVSTLTLKELIKAQDESPYPALTQIEAWGIITRDEN